MLKLEYFATRKSGHGPKDEIADSFDYKNIMLSKKYEHTEKNK